ncbi:ABC transporter ATP-binding protein [Treponema denticola]|uniref:ABC transporter ATP-binding protein n=1 Tax=Treponema denticola TaxID=158 RepID=UPI0020A5F669|nr:ABC transporter ATP-binding protein [Treponema denticola]UTC98437.1 ABC transporter ATP-binding protein [Treponema denticola]UTD08207.1 ABC transporter ATP-binding protein [Treponema denticola]
MVLDISSLSFNFGSKNILADIDLSIKDNGIVGIIGPNGSGKSTLLKCIYRVLKPKTGTIFIDGKNINDYQFKETAKKMAVVAQHNDTHFDFNVLEMVLIGRSPHKKFMERDSAEDIELAYKALEQVNMKDFADRNFSSLSGGEKQRIILARALVQNTDCLILDEPTNHLDIKHQLHFMSLAKDLKITVISAIHDLNIAAMYCDKIYALKEGQIIASGSVDEVITEEVIKTLYDVEAKIIYDEEKKPHVIFKNI